MNYQYPLALTHKQANQYESKNRMTGLALKRVVCAGLVANVEVLRVWWVENRGV
jgi:hypothetical protein